MNFVLVYDFSPLSSQQWYPSLKDLNIKYSTKMSLIISIDFIMKKFNRRRMNETNVEGINK